MEGGESGRAVEQLRKIERQLRTHNQVLAQLARRKPQLDNALEPSLREITEAAASTLEIERASVWLYNDGRSQITCVDLFERTAARHSAGLDLEAKQFPSYFSALEEERTITANDAHEDRRTREFSQSYLTPLGIGAMLDAPIWVHGQMVGVICHEHVGPSRVWTVEEEHFAGAMADTVALAIEAHERQRAEDGLRRANDELELRVKERTAALAVANEEIMRFAYIVSHDLRGPLVNLKGFAGELRSAFEVVHGAVSTVLGQLDERRREQALNALEKDVPEALGFIDTSVMRMDQQIGAILRLCRVGHRALVSEEIDVEQLVQVTLKTLAHQIEQRRVSVAVGILPRVTADRASLEQIFANLLSNAIAYLDPRRPGEIEITAERDDEMTTLHVRDNGRGIAAGDLERVFELFRRVGPPDVPGEGIGLAYARALVRRHGGRIWCTSTLSTGSTFHFTLANQAEVDE
jgi:signal transduction histidine kinase